MPGQTLVASALAVPGMAERVMGVMAGIMARVVMPIRRLVELVIG